MPCLQPDLASPRFLTLPHAFFGFSTERHVSALSLAYSVWYPATFGKTTGGRQGRLTMHVPALPNPELRPRVREDLARLKLIIALALRF
jgi:hypothetical protein